MDITKGKNEIRISIHQTFVNKHQVATKASQEESRRGDRGSKCKSSQVLPYDMFSKLVLMLYTHPILIAFTEYAGYIQISSFISLAS